MKNWEIRSWMHRRCYFNESNNHHFGTKRTLDKHQLEHNWLRKTPSFISRRPKVLTNNKIQRGNKQSPKLIRLVNQVLVKPFTYCSGASPLSSLVYDQDSIQNGTLIIGKEREHFESLHSRPCLATNTCEWIKTEMRGEKVQKSAFIKSGAMKRSSGISY